MLEEKPVPRAATGWSPAAKNDVKLLRKFLFHISAPKPETPKTPKSVKAPKHSATPTRQSARLAAKADAISDDDETHGKKAIPNPDHKPKKGFALVAYLKSLKFEWVGALFMMALFPFILVSLHTLCTKTSCKPALPFDKLPKTLKEVWDPQAFLTVVGFTLVLRLLSFIPLGSTVTTSTDKTGKKCIKFS